MPLPITGQELKEARPNLCVSKSGFVLGFTFRIFHVSEVAFLHAQGTELPGNTFRSLLSGFSGVGETWMLIKITEPHHF